VGLYTQETDQDNLTFGSALFGGRPGQGPCSGIIEGKCSNKQYLIFPMKRDNLFACVTIFLTGKGKNQIGASLILDYSQ